MIKCRVSDKRTGSFQRGREDEVSQDYKSLPGWTRTDTRRRQGASRSSLRVRLAHGCNKLIGVMYLDKINYNYIINPITGKILNIHSKVGLNLLLKYNLQDRFYNSLHTGYTGTLSGLNI